MTAQPAQSIRGARLRAVDVPLPIPIVAKIGSFERWPLLLIDLEMSDGVVGRAYLMPYLERSVHYLVPMIEDLVAHFAGQPLGPAELFDAARKSLSVIGLEGLSLAAIATVDMAAWDASARRANQPLAVHLGGSVGQLRAYNSNGLWLSDPDGIGEQARLLANQGGFDALKLRLGRDRLADDLRAAQAVRDVLGDEPTIMVDFNQGQSFDRALRRLRELDGFGFEWFEEPVAYDDFTSAAELRRRLATPIQIGENFWGPRMAEMALAAGACDFIMPDLMRIGGVTGWLRTEAIAAARGVPVSSHLYPEVSAHLMRVTETKHWIEWVNWSHPVIETPFEVDGGHIIVPDRPGNGIEWNEAGIAEHAIEIDRR